MAQTRTGVAAKQIERETGVTYKTAWRMCQLIRKSMEEKRDLFTGTVEMDESYFGGDPRYNIKRKRGRGTSKQPVFGMAERGGAVVAKVVPNTKRETLMPIVEDQVADGAEIHTDEYVVYKALEGMGYDHKCVNHRQKEYVRYEKDGKMITTNELEGWWSYPKGATKTVHRGVSDRYLQRYLDEYAFRQSHRHDEEPMFLTILGRVSQEISSDPVLS